MPWSPLARCIAALLLMSAALSAQTSPAAPDVDPGSAREDVVVESVVTRIAFDEAGERTASVAATLRVNTPAGVQQEGTLAIPFRRDAGIVTVDYVRVRKPDGSVVDTPTGASFDLPAPITQQAPVYSDLYLKHINVQALQPGDRLEYRWQIVEPSLVPGHFWTTYDFDTLSRARQTLEVSWPASRRPIVKSLGPQPTMATEAGRTTYAWESTGTGTAEGAVLPGPPHVQISSFRDWEDVGTVVRDLWRGRADVTPAIRARALELTDGITDNEQKARALYRYVATSIRYVGVEVGIGRIQPNSAPVVLANGFGDCKDKHILLEALLRAVGIEARPVLMNPGVAVDADVPSLGAFSHVVTLIEDTLPAPVWLDTTLEVAPFGFLIATERSATVLPIAPAGEARLVTTPATAVRGNVWRTETTGALSIDGRLEATVRETLSGDLEVLMRTAFRAAPRQNWEQVVQALPVAQARSAAVSDLVVSPPEDTDAPFTLAYRYVVDAFVDWGRGDLRPPDIIVPEAVLAPADGEDVVNLGMAAELVSVSRIALPDGVEVGPGTASDIDLGNDRVRYQFRWAMKDRVVETERRLASLADEIPVAGLPEYRAFRNAVRESPTTINLRRLTPWAWNDAPTIEWYRGAGPSAVEALQAASAMGRRGDYQASIAASRRLIDADPDSDAAWQMLGWAQFTEGSHERALATMRRRVPLVATPSLIKYYADRLTSLGRHADAADAWRLGRQRFPGDREIPLYLGATLIRIGEPAEAVEVLRSQADVQRESARYHMVLGEALLAAGDAAAATTTLLRSAEIDDTVDHLNRVAWHLGDSRIALDDALRLARRAVGETTVEVNALTLGEVGVPQLELLPVLTAYWDTLGWIHFRRGEAADARRYLEAAWQLSELPVIAQHLSEVYAAVNDTDAARLRTFAEAASVTASNRARLANDGGERARVLADARNTLERMRTFALPRPVALTRSEEVLIAVAADGSVRDALVVGNSTGGDDVAAAIESMTIPWSAPDADISQIIRRGTVSCAPTSNQCTLVLQPVGSAVRALQRP